MNNKNNGLDKLAMLLFVVFSGVYFYIATIISDTQLKGAFDVIQGTHVFDVDDTYRAFLARDIFVADGLWAWNYYLPGNALFDGFFSWLTGHNLLWMRVTHILAVLSSLYLVYRAGRHLGITATWMLLSTLLLLLMPLFILTSMSFYGESLLAASMGVVLYSIATQKEKLQISFLSIFPLIRPEGFLFLATMAVQKLLEKRIVSVIFLGLPGFIFFCHLMVAFDFNYGNFNAWREALTAHYPLAPVEESAMGYPLMPYYTINPVFWLLGLLGAFLPGLKRFRPLFIALAFLMLHWFTDALQLKARGEARYFLAALPLLALSFAALIQSAQEYLQKRFSSKWGVTLILAIIPLFIGIENLAQIDPLRAGLFGDRRWPLAGERGAKDYLGVLPPDVENARITTANFLAAYTAYDKSIDKIIVHTYQVFENIDPRQLPEGVDIEYSPMMPEKSFQYFGGYFFTMFPMLPQYSLYLFSPAINTQPDDGKHYALYVGPLYNGIHEPLYANPFFQVYKVSYESRQNLPQSVLENKR